MAGFGSGSTVSKYRLLYHMTDSLTILNTFLDASDSTGWKELFKEIPDVARVASNLPRKGSSTCGPLIAETMASSSR